VAQGPGTTIAALAAAGFALLAIELITPGLVVGLLGTICLGAAVVLAFKTYGVLAGAGLLVVSVAGGGALLRYGLRRLGSRHAHDPAHTAADPSLAALVGQDGVAASPLRPSGYALFGERRIDVVTRGEALDAGTPVRAIAAEGSHVVVRRIP
jgi:membrane-bound serine protease (ClpP class)